MYLSYSLWVTQFILFQHHQACRVPRISSLSPSGQFGKINFLLGTMIHVIYQKATDEWHMFPIVYSHHSWLIVPKGDHMTGHMPASMYGNRRYSISPFSKNPRPNSPAPLRVLHPSNQSWVKQLLKTFVTIISIGSFIVCTLQPRTFLAYCNR